MCLDRFYSFSRQVKMFRALVLFCAVLALGKGQWQSTQVSQCNFSNSGPLPLNAYIAGCDTPPCRLPQGQDAQIEVIFRAPYTMQRMTTSAWAYLPLSPLPMPYGLNERAQTCNYLQNTYCPVLKDEVMIYRLDMPIESFMPVGTQLPIEFRIQDDNNRYIMCIRVVVNIQPPVGKLGAQNSTITV